MPLSRKVLIRVLGAPLLLAALGGILYLGHRCWTKGLPNIPLDLLLYFVGWGCLWETRAMCSARGISIDLVAPSVALAFLFGMNLESAWRPWGGPLEGWALVTLVAGLYVLSMLVFRYGRFPAEAGALTFLAYGYISLLVLIVLPPVPRPIGTLYLVFLLAAGKGSDMAAYVAGKTIGRHKMAPVVSPNKTWEGGIAGGIVGTGGGLAILVATPLRSAYASVPVAALLFFALLVTIAAQVGDLVKSAFKRWAGVKDSGRLLPEFGGMLDMVDSFLIAAPVAHLGSKVLFLLF